MIPPVPYLSVIVPAFQGSSVLPRSLQALTASDLPRECWELIVVDDGSTDDTATIAARYADTVVRLPGKPRGPAYARNRGFEVSRGECVVFLDADVCVHGDTLSSFALLFANKTDVGAVFGSYDNSPPAPGIVSQYRNLLHHYTHQRGAGEAETFWAGCGAIRRQAFIDAGKFDEWHYPRPQIEDIELGHRLRSAGYRIILRPEIQCTHLKQWTLRKLVATDLNDRGVPWMRLLIQEGVATKSRTLNLRTIEKINTVLVWLSLLSAVGAAFTLLPVWVLLAATLIVPVIGFNRSLYALFARQRGALFALATVPLHFLYYLLNGLSAAFGWMLHQTMGDPRPDPAVEAFAEVGVKTWPPVPAKRKFGTSHKGRLR